MRSWSRIKRRPWQWLRLFSFFLKTFPFLIRYLREVSFSVLIEFVSQCSNWGNEIKDEFFTTRWFLQRKENLKCSLSCHEGLSHWWCIACRGACAFSFFSAQSRNFSLFPDCFDCCCLPSFSWLEQGTEDAEGIVKAAKNWEIWSLKYLLNKFSIMPQL